MYMSLIIPLTAVLTTLLIFTLTLLRHRGQPSQRDLEAQRPSYNSLRRRCQSEKRKRAIPELYGDTVVMCAELEGLGLIGEMCGGRDGWPGRREREVEREAQRERLCELDGRGIGDGRRI